MGEGVLWGVHRVILGLYGVVWGYMGIRVSLDGGAPRSA